jgi:hypothetical protein
VSHNNVVNGNGFGPTPVFDIAIVGNGALGVNLVGNTGNGYVVSNLQYFSSGNTAPIINGLGATQVFTPFP